MGNSFEYRCNPATGRQMDVKQLPACETLTIHKHSLYAIRIPVGALPLQYPAFALVIMCVDAIPES